jgi:3'-phosphoadenosine 5'-phosphosulfate (PAPS) 3'-phosphatase
VQQLAIAGGATAGFSTMSMQLLAAALDTVDGYSRCNSRAAAKDAAAGSGVVKAADCSITCSSSLESYSTIQYMLMFFHVRNNMNCTHSTGTMYIHTCKSIQS